MAFKNNSGKSVSFDCSGLIKELQADIEEFGGDRILKVVTEEKEGVTIYKDYVFADGDKDIGLWLSQGEKIRLMTASALLILYEEENSIL